MYFVVKDINNKNLKDKEVMVLIKFIFYSLVWFLQKVDEFQKMILGYY